MRKWVALAIAVLLVAGGIYVGSPYYAALNLKSAAVSGDPDRLEAAVDFPAVRESLKAQFSVALTRRMNREPDMRDSPLAGLGRLMMPVLVDRMVDAVVDPDALAALVRGSRSLRERQPPHTQNPDVRYDYQWVSPDRFRVKLSNSRTREEGPSFLFERRGFAGWKLITLELPPDMLGAR
jgi:hypothetical protein